MSFSLQDKPDEQNELVGQLCNENLDAAGRSRLSELLSHDIEAQREYVRYVDLQTAMWLCAQSLDDEDFALLEAQAALDAMPTCFSEDTSIGEDRGATCPSEKQGGVSAPPIIPFAWRFDPFRVLAQNPLVWTASAAVLLIGISITALERMNESPTPPPVPMARSQAISAPLPDPARLRGAVGARWAGTKLELPEGEVFVVGQRLELIEGLAEVHFSGGARVVMQGPAILQIRDDNSASVPVGRIAAIVPKSTSGFTLHTAVADLTSTETEFGAEIDLDGSLVTRVYSGDVDVKFNRGTMPRENLQLAHGEAARLDGKSSQAALLEQPIALHFVRYLPSRETLINLAEVVAGGSSMNKAFHRGLSLLDGRAVDDYGAPVQGDGRYHLAQSCDFVDGVFVPNGKQGPVQIDSIGRHFAGFPPTAGDSWGGAIMARRPNKENTLPLIRMEFYGDNYGYVNWLHIASKPDELSPQGHGLIGMHSNAGITFDLHAIRARYPDKKILRFRTLVGNLESRSESDTSKHTADAWVIIDGQLRHRRQGFNRESGPEAIDVPLTDRDRFLVLAVTDDGGDTAYDWVAFGDAVIELITVEGISIDDSSMREGRDSAEQDERLDAAPQRRVGATGPRNAEVGVVVSFIGPNETVNAAAPDKSKGRG